MKLGLIVDSAEGVIAAAEREQDGKRAEERGRRRRKE